MENQEIIALMEEVLRRRKQAQRKALQHSSLHISQPAVLIYISKHPGCSQKQIADEAHVTPASVATSLKRLEKNGMIMRREDTADTRCNRVYITAAGERELDYCRNALQSIDEMIVSEMSDTEQNNLRSVMLQMNNRLIQYQKNK